MHLDAEPIGDGSGSDPASPRAMFDSNVYPILVTECSDCHSTGMPNPYGFVSASVADAYTTVMAYHGLMGDFTLAGTPLVTDADDLHPASFTPSELQVIDQWLAAERAARGL